MAIGAVERGALVVIHDPRRPTGNQTGHRGLCVVEAVDGDEVAVRSLSQTHLVFRVARATIQTAYSATYVAEELFK